MAPPLTNLLFVLLIGATIAVTIYFQRRAIARARDREDTAPARSTGRTVALLFVAVAVIVLGSLILVAR